MVPHHTRRGAPLRQRLGDLQLRYDLRTGRLYIYDPDPRALPTHSRWRLVWPRFAHTRDAAYRLPGAVTVERHRWWEFRLALPAAPVLVAEVDAGGGEGLTIDTSTVIGEPARRSA